MKIKEDGQMQKSSPQKNSGKESLKVYYVYLLLRGKCFEVPWCTIHVSHSKDLYLDALLCAAATHLIEEPADNYTDEDWNQQIEYHKGRLKTEFHKDSITIYQYK